jgi:hypothetical protein
LTSLSKKQLFDKINAIVKKRGGKLISKDIKNTKDIVALECNLKHQWTTRYGKIVYNNQWCQKCSKNNPLSKKQLFDKIKALVKKRGGKLISKDIKNTRDIVALECNLKHYWTTRYDSVVYTDRWCPECNKKFHFSENICKKYIEYLFDKRFLTVRPDWLLSAKGRRMELDGYCEELQIAFEHQGIQHYNILSRFGDRNIQKRDILKAALCKKHNVKLIIIPSLLSITKLESLHIKIESELIRLEIPYDKDRLKELSKVVDINNIRNIDFVEKYDNICDIAKEKGGECLSSEFINRYNKMKFKCAYGHIWESAARNIVRGTWCTICLRTKGKNK